MYPGEPWASLWVPLCFTCLWRCPIQVMEEIVCFLNPMCWSAYIGLFWWTNALDAEISMLNCRMMEEGIKDRRWTEAFASMWAALEGAIFVLVVNWTLINTGIIMMLFKCISGNLQVLPSLTQLGFCAWCSYGDLCAWSGKNWMENGLWHYQTQVT